MVKIGPPPCPLPLGGGDARQKNPPRAQFHIVIPSQREGAGGRAFLLFLLCLLLSGCKLPDDPSPDPKSTYAAFWEEIDKGYAFFAFKHVDWDSVRRVQEPKLRDNMSPEALLALMDQATLTFRDGHTWIDAGFDVRTYDFNYLNRPANWDLGIWERNYFYSSPYHRVTGPFYNTIIDSIGYIYYSSFESDFSDGDLNYVLRRFSGTKGLIIDVRENGGGLVDGAIRLASRLLAESRLVYRQQVKSGPGHEEFTKLEDVRLEPSGQTRYLGKVCILTNRKCFSATNGFVATVKGLPNLKIVGDTTGGGGGLPITRQLPNGWLLTFSGSRTFLPDGFNIENGIPPDVQVDFTPADLAIGRDPILEKALELLR